MQGVNTQATLKYTLLPGILPRLKRLFGTGFVAFSTLMAQIYGMAGLLPANHPYLDPANRGRFGVRHVIAEAANNLVLNRKNIDKIFIFIALLVGAIILVLQFVLFSWMLLVNHAWAIPIADLFDTLNPENDIAFNILTLVFGIPDLYCSSSAPGNCAAANATITATPFPIHAGLHDLFEFYSFGLLLIGVLIFLYFVVVVVAETAVTGSPFGRRFQNVWVPIRLVVALGLLVPINYGLNTGQYITLYAAKLGSSIATNGWLRYNNTIEAHSLFGGDGNGANPTGERETLIGLPKRSSIAPLVQAMSLVHTCAYSYWYNASTSAGTRSFGAGHYHYSAPPAAPAWPAPNPVKIRAWFVKTAPIAGFGALGNATIHEVEPGTTVEEALDFYGNGNITIRFGEYMETATNPHNDTGQVKPFCGDITIPVTDVKGRGVAIGGPGSSASMIILELYFNMTKNLWFRGYGSAELLKNGAIFFYEVTNNIPDRVTRSCSGEACGGGRPGLPTCGAMLGTYRLCATVTPGKEWVENIIDQMQISTDIGLVAAWEFYVQNSGIEIEDEILNRGWAGAGMWFNRLADLNSSFQTAVDGVPQIAAFPSVMENVRDQIRQHDPGVNGIEQFRPNTSQGTQVALPQDDINRAKALYKNYEALVKDGVAGGNPETEVVYNFFMDAMNMIFGVDGIFDIRGTNVHTHPLVQLIMIGKGMVESTIRNLGGAAGLSFMGGIAKVASGSNDNILSALSGFLFSTAFFGLTAGIVLFYVIPFLPFVYFFFAVLSWVKTIFEAMVGVPLWALAHLRLDGEGLPGDSASNGYFLIFEIGLRPILTIFGLIAAIVIFTAQVRVLHFIWDIVVENTAGFSNAPPDGITLNNAYFDPASTVDRDAVKRGIVDQFFFTVIYTIIVYMLATASFKLIDSIPDNIMRWGGIGVASFGDTNQDPLEGMQRYVAVGGMVQGQQLTQSVMGAADGAGRAVGTATGLQGILARNVAPPG